MTLQNRVVNQSGTMASGGESLGGKPVLDFRPQRTRESVAHQTNQLLNPTLTTQLNNIRIALDRFEEFSGLVANSLKLFDPSVQKDILEKNKRNFHELLDVIFVHSGIVSTPRIQTKYEHIKSVIDGPFDMNFPKEMKNFWRGLGGIKMILQLNRESAELRLSNFAQK